MNDEFQNKSELQCKNKEGKIVLLFLIQYKYLFENFNFVVIQLIL